MDSTRTPRERAAPLRPARAIARPRVAQVLDGVRTVPVTVVSAPAGFGKTLAVAEWCETRCPDPVTWLDGADESLLDGLAGWLADLERPRVVVVDDLRTDDGGRALDAIARQLHGREGLHLIVTTRLQVAADLAGARLAGVLEIVGERHLGFDSPEVVALVSLVAAAVIRVDLASALVEELEGWPAGAMLLALDWDPACTLGNHHTKLAAGYRSCRTLLAAHVVDGLDPSARQVVVDTSVFAEVSAELCEAVTGQPDAAQLLRDLHRSGRFLEQSSSAPAVYRFHRLARAALRDAPGGSGTQQQALQLGAEWYLEHGLPVLAAACYVELRDWDAMAGLVFGNLFGLLTSEQVSDLVALLARIPAAVLEERWTWTFGATYLLLSLGEFATALALLATVEPRSTAPQRVVSEVLRSTAASFLEDPSPSLVAAEHALAMCDELGDDAEFPEVFESMHTAHWRAQAHGSALMAGAFLGAWDRVAPHAGGSVTASAFELPPAALARLRGQRACYFALAGVLSQAEHEAAGVWAVVADDRTRGEPFGAAAHVATGDVLRGRCRFDEALEEHQQGADRAALGNRLNLVAFGIGGAALVHVDQGRPDEALRVLADHRRATVHRPPATLRARLDAAEVLALHRSGAGSRLPEVVRSLGDPTSIPLAAALVVVHLERGDLAQAERVVAAWPADPTLMSSVHHDLACAALAELRGRRGDATEHLSAALGAAAPHGWLQPFTQLGVFVLRPLRVVGDQGAVREVQAHARAVSALIDQTSGALALLTPRERLVLHQLTSTASLPELAEHLMVSANTIKTQVRAIYRKLGVANRSDAVEVWRAAGEPPAG